MLYKKFENFALLLNFFEYSPMVVIVQWRFNGKFSGAAKKEQIFQKSWGEMKKIISETGEHIMHKNMRYFYVV